MPLEIPLSEQLAQNRQKPIRGQNAFNFQLFLQIYSAQESAANVLLSPLSISIALLLLFNRVQALVDYYDAEVQSFTYSCILLSDRM